LLGDDLIIPGNSMRKIINNTFKTIFVSALAVMTTSCSLLSDISNSLIELEVSYNEFSVIDDVGEIYSYPIDEKHISSIDAGIKYMDNEILIVVDPQTDLNAVNALAEKYGGEVVGCIEKTGDYQILLKAAHTFDDIKSLVAAMSTDDIVISAYPNYVARVFDNTINYGDKWKDDLKKADDCKGKSWGVEAINAPAAWKLLEQNSEKVNKNLRVGIIDSGFDMEHEDLGFAERFPNYNTEVSEHGTHVAGTMAAISDNKQGICGVYPYGNGNLYAISYLGVTKYGENGNMWSSFMSQKIMYSELILRNVKVINQSQGFNWYQFDKNSPVKINNKEVVINSGIDEFTQWWNNFENGDFSVYVELSNHLAEYFHRLLSMGYDFVIVGAAGNDSNYAAQHLESRYSSWIGLIDSKYTDVINRIIIVGSVDKKNNISSFSNAGGRVDVYAPGENIYSTIPKNKYSNINWSGTSMASPHVAGVAAMVWAANSDFTGEMVKLVVCGLTSDKGTGVNIVDAEKAVRYALNKDISDWTDKNKTDDPSLGSIMSYVVTADTNESRILGATVTAVNIETEERASTTTDVNGHFELILPKGKYKVSIDAEGYETYIYEGELICNSNGVNYVDWAKLISKKKYVDYFYNKTIGEVIDYYGKENCSEYTLLHGNIGVYVPFLQYVFIPENNIMDSQSKIASIVVLENGEMFPGAIIGSAAISTVGKTHGKFGADKIEVSDVNGNYVYIDKPTDNMTYYIDLNEEPVSESDSADNHMGTMILQSGLAKFRYDDNEQMAATNVVDVDWIENARTQVTQHYKNFTGLSGEFVCFSNEDIIDNEFVKFVLRYSDSQEEIRKIIEAGGMPHTNVYQSLIEIEIKTGKVTDESGNVWYLDFQNDINQNNYFADECLIAKAIYTNASVFCTECAINNDIVSDGYYYVDFSRSSPFLKNDVPVWSDFFAEYLIAASKSKILGEKQYGNGFGFIAVKNGCPESVYYTTDDPLQTNNYKIGVYPENNMQQFNAEKYDDKIIIIDQSEIDAMATEIYSFSEQAFFSLSKQDQSTLLLGDASFDDLLEWSGYDLNALSSDFLRKYALEPWVHIDINIAFDKNSSITFFIECVTIKIDDNLTYKCMSENMIGMYEKN